MSRVVKYYPILDDAIALSGCQVEKCVIVDREFAPLKDEEINHRKTVFVLAGLTGLDSV